MRKIFERKRIWSIILVFVLLVSHVSGCGVKKDPTDEISDEQLAAITEKVVEDITAGLVQEKEPNSIVEELHLKAAQNPSGVEESGTIFGNIPVADKKYTSDDEWKRVQEFTKREEYWDDTEAFVYNLIASELKYRYDVFPAYVELKDGTWICGIAYSDYTECYSNEDASHYYFTAGFMPFADEEPIPEEEFNYGLLLHNADYKSENFSFLLTYLSGEYTEHCVVYNQYVKYGADAKGHIAYTTAEYVRGECEESLGSLYSYDEKRYVRNVDLGNYVLLSGTTLSEQINYAQLEQEINALLEQQDFNFVTVNVESNAYYAQEAVKSYLLALQEETFLGYRVSDLVEAAENLDARQVLRITNDGLAVIDLKNGPKEGAEAVASWLIGTTCVIITAVGVVTALVTVTCPVLSACAGAVTGTAIDVFMQVVIENEDLQDVSWEKVALSAVTGAVSGFLGPYISASVGGVSGFFLDSTIDGLLGGIEYAAITWLDGGRGMECISSFGYGLALGGILSAGFKCVGGIVARTAEKMGPSISKLGREVFPSLTEKASNIKTALINLKEGADNSIFQSSYIAERTAYKNIKVYAAEAVEDVTALNKAIGIEELNQLNNTEIFAEGKLAHIFFGEINTKRGAAVGFHTECMNGPAKVIARTTPDEQGIYEVMFELIGEDGKIYTKTSTMFPEYMGRQEIVDAINEAYNNRKKIAPAKYEGTSKDGLLIHMYLENGEIATAYPVKRK